MSTVAHTVLEFGPDDVIIPRSPDRRLVVAITASYRTSWDSDVEEVQRMIAAALQNLVPQSPELNRLTAEEEEPTARVEIHNIPEEPGT